MECPAADTLGELVTDPMVRQKLLQVPEVETFLLGKAGTVAAQKEITRWFLLGMGCII